MVMSFLCCPFFPRSVLDEILNLIESVSEGFPSYSFIQKGGIDTTLISTCVIMAGIGLAVPVMLPLEIVAIVCGCIGTCVKLVGRKLMSKAQKKNTMRLKLLETVS